MKFKQGIKIAGVCPELLMGLMVVNHIFAYEFNVDMVITACTDGVHRTGSKHYVGQAVDIRISNISDPVGVVNRLKFELDGLFDIVLEKDHIHFEYDQH
jgi:hypothetical protein